MKIVGEMPDEQPERCLKSFEFGGLDCDREKGHPGPHCAKWAGGTVWFNNQGKRIEGGSAEDYA